MRYRQGDQPSTGCAATCLHRQFVTDYHRERDAQLVRAERVTKGYERETAEYFGPDGPERRWTFKRHLTTYAGVDYPYHRTPNLPTWAPTEQATA